MTAVRLSSLATSSKRALGSFGVILGLTLAAGCVLDPVFDFDSDGTVDLLDCAPQDPNIFPGAEELCNGLDDDCDGELGPEEIDGDSDGFLGCLNDCDDDLEEVFPGANEACNSRDDDCDGEIDEGVDGSVDLDADGVPCSEDCDDTDASLFPGNLENCDGADSDCDGDSACRLVQISAGDRYTCGVDPVGGIACWGPDDGGEHDKGQVSGAPTTREWVEVSAGSEHACALSQNGSITCWGGLLEELDKIPTGGDFVGVSAGGSHSCALRSSGQITCWGLKSSFELLGTSAVCSFDSEAYSSVVAGNNNTCAINSSGQVDCCGRNDHGQSAPPGDLRVSMLRPGWNHACGLTLDGEIRCWGIDQAHTYNFGQVDDQPSGVFVALGGRDDTSCAIRDPSADLDRIHCWGRDNYGQASQAPSEGQWAEVTAGAYHGCAVAVDGTVTCWGADSDGQATPP